VQRGDLILALNIHRSAFVQQELRHLEITIFGCQMERGEALFSLHGERGSFVDQNCCNLFLTRQKQVVVVKPDESFSKFCIYLSFFSCNVQGGIIITSGRVDLGAMLVKEHDNIGISQTTRNVQRRLVFLTNKCRDTTKNQSLKSMNVSSHL